MREISWLAENQVASQEGLCSMGLVKFMGLSMESFTPYCLKKSGLVFQFNRMIRNILKSTLQLLILSLINFLCL